MSGDSEVFITAIKDLLAKLKADPKAWAKRILDRQAEGERFPPYVVQCALEVSGDAPQPHTPREPGED